MSFRQSNIAQNIKRLLFSLRDAYHCLRDIVVEAFARMAPRSNPVLETISVNDVQRGSNSAAVYVHFDCEGVVFDYVLHQLKQLVEAGFDITFVSNSPTFPEQSRKRIWPFCRNIICRSNTGYDFGAYKDGIASLPDIDSIDRLVLMNDSVYGPLWNLGDSLSKLDRNEMDYWGIAETYEGGRHCQTFFLLFFPAALRSTAFQGFWQDLPYVNDKRWVIRNGEIRLGLRLARHGLRLQALAPYWPLAESAQQRMAKFGWTPPPSKRLSFFNRIYLVLLQGRPINPMHYFWDIVITEYRCPFIKRELIQSNPAKIPSVDTWRDVIRSVSDYDVTLIDDHQNALRKRRS